ncbi:MAG: hypothetical protein ACUVWB_05050 [Anaerolineae bacterium]
MSQRRLDLWLLFLLLMARVRIDTLADLVLPTRHQDVARLPLVQRLFSPHAQELLRDWLTDPLSLVLISTAFAGFFLYLLADLAQEHWGEKRVYPAKLALIWVIVGATVLAGTAKLIALRQMNGPASYCHDGGVIQTEEAVKLFLAGRNPYVEDYTQTPLAEWGLDLRSALYHYPYLPWTFVFSAPFYLLSQAVWGYFDERMVYLPLFVLTLLMSLRLARRPSHRLMLLMALGLNPIMGSDVIFGQNDIFVLCWMMLAWWFLPQKEGERRQEWRYLASSAAAGLALASKPTAWFMLPFHLLALWEVSREGRRWDIAPRGWSRALPMLVVFLALAGPYFLWSPAAFVDDIWKWASGTSATPYQIRGWGFANFVLALGLVESRLSYFPFWIPQALTSVPLLIALLWRQVTRRQGIAGIALYTALLLFVYAFFSRFFNENYVGFIAALLTIGILAGEGAPHFTYPTTQEA